MKGPTLKLQRILEEGYKKSSSAKEAIEVMNDVLEFLEALLNLKKDDIEFLEEEIKKEHKTSQLLYTVKQFTTKHPWITPGGLRSELFNRDYNGLAKTGAVVRNNRKILIDEDKYLAWVRDPNKPKGNIYNLGKG